MSSRNNALSHLALQKFKKNFWGVFSFWYLILVTLIALFAYVLAPDNSTNANQMHVSIHSKKPGFKVNMLVEPPFVKTKQSYLNKLFFGNKNAPIEIPLSNYNKINDSVYYTEYTANNLVKETKVKAATNCTIETKKFVFGTDMYGRDYLSRILIGSRISLSIGLIAVLIALAVGIILGSIAGYFGGKTDVFIMFLINITWSIPTLLLVIAITLTLGKGFWQVFIAVGLTMWVEVARIVRGQVIDIKNKPFITAAKALGYSHSRIILKHILPNSLTPILVISAANFAAAILIESGLSFLGIGAQPPTPSWGAMIKDHYNYIILGKPYLALIPGFCIMSLVMACMLIGNALRDALDVKE